MAFVGALVSVALVSVVFAFGAKAMATALSLSVFSGAGFLASALGFFAYVLGFCSVFLGFWASDLGSLASVLGSLASVLGFGSANDFIP